MIEHDIVRGCIIVSGSSSHTFHSIVVEVLFGGVVVCFTANNLHTGIIYLEFDRLKKLDISIKTEQGEDLELKRTF